MKIAGIIRPDWPGRGRFLIVTSIYLMCIISGLLLLYAAQNTKVVILGLMALFLSLLLVRWPLLSVAIFFNGQAAYFYVLYKLGMKPNTIITGIFFIILVCTYILGMTLAGRRMAFKPLDLWIGLLMVWIITSYLLFSFRADWSTKKLLYAPLLAIAPYIMGKMINRNGDTVKFVDSVVVISKILALVFLGELVLSSQFRDVTRYSPFEFEGINNPILIGITFTIPLLIICLSVLEGKQKLGLKAILWMALFSYLSMRAASRGAIISFLIAVLFYVLILRPRRKHFAKLFILGAIFIVIAAQLPLRVLEFYRETTISSDVNSATQRINLWQKAMDDFKRNPLAGSGFGNFYNEMPMMGQTGPSFAHNIFLEVAAELGLIGIIILINILFLTTRVFVAMKASSVPKLITPEVSIVTSLLVYTIIEAQFSGFLTSQTYLFIMLGIYSGLSKPGLISRKAGKQCLAGS